MEVVGYVMLSALVLYMVQQIADLAACSLAALALALIVLVAPAALSQTYTVEIRPTLNDLDVKIEPVSKSNMLVLRLTNNTDQRVRCRLRYEAPPQTTFRSSLNVDPGRTEQSVFRARRKWFAVVVEVNCEARP